MEIKLIATTSTKDLEGKDDFNKLSGTLAGICYMPQTFDELLAEPEEKTIRRSNMNKKGGHHSVFEHEFITLYLEDVPKIFAMLLNNEQFYTTSEKSARYTKMEPSEIEKKLYYKWVNNYKNLIKQTYPNECYLSESRIEKLAMENARYLLSIYTPTSLAYTTTYAQLNYYYNWFKNDNKPNKLLESLKPFTEKFCTRLEELNLIDDDLQKMGDGRHFSLISNKNREEYFGDVYCTSYEGSLASYAQAERHRTLSYELEFLPTKNYYVPKILAKDEDLLKEWLDDMDKVKTLTPQGELVKINERGTLEKFISKMRERICTCAQLEIQDQTLETLNKYLTQTNDEEIKEILTPYAKGARCTNGFKCGTPCGFKPGIDLTREI